MADDLVVQYGKLKLSDGEVVAVEGDGGEGSSANMEQGFMLVSRLLSIQPFNHKSVR